MTKSKFDMRTHILFCILNFITICLFVCLFIGNELFVLYPNSDTLQHLKCQLVSKFCGVELDIKLEDGKYLKSYVCTFIFID